jgi:hypothetical protein
MESIQQSDYLVAYFDVYNFSKQVQDRSLNTLSEKLHAISEDLVAEAAKRRMKIYLLSDCGFLLCRMASGHRRLGQAESRNRALTFTIVLQEFCDLFLKRGLLLRGGAAFGKTYVKGSVVVGKPVIEASRLEAAIPAPIIVFPVDLVHMFKLEAFIAHHELALKGGRIVRAGVIIPSDVQEYLRVLEQMTENAILLSDPESGKSKNALDFAKHLVQGATQSHTRQMAQMASKEETNA